MFNWDFAVPEMLQQIPSCDCISAGLYHCYLFHVLQAIGQLQDLVCVCQNWV